MKHYIYILRDPETKQVRYVGQTTNTKSRLSNHLYKSKNPNNHCQCWIKSILSKGLKPIMEVIEECEENYQIREIFWISYYKEHNCNLTNISKGGEGNNTDPITLIKSNLKSNSELFNEITKRINEGILNQTEIEKDLGLSRGFISRVRGGFVKSANELNIVLPESKVDKFKLPKTSWNKGISSNKISYHYSKTVKRWRVTGYKNNKRTILKSFLLEEEAKNYKEKVEYSIERGQIIY